MKKLVFILFWLPMFGVAQNLVPDPSFEEFTQCPVNALGINYLNDWEMYFSANYFNECGINGHGVPFNVFGFQEPLSDSGYVGIYTFWEYSLSREFVWVELLDTLKADKYYDVKFYVNMSDSVWYATKNIGAYFSINQKPENRDTLMSLKPQVIYTGSEFLDDKEGWMEISGRFKADGGEKYMIIGNFDDDTKTDTSFVPGGGAFRPNQPYYWSSAYYYIDDVSVTLDTTTSINEPEIGKFGLYPNPNDGEVTIDWKALDKKAELSITDLQGKEVERIVLTANQNQIKLDTSTYPRGIYLCTFYQNNKKLASERLVVVK